MKQQLIKLKKVRESRERLKAEWQEKLDKLEDEYKHSLDLIRGYSEQIEIIETEIKNVALEKYQETGEKKLDFGIGIRVMSKLGYDPDIALKWGLEHSMALTLDKKAFEKIAKVNKLDFVEYREEAIATIPREIKVD